MAGLHSQWEGRGDDLTICTSNKFQAMLMLLVLGAY